MKSRFLILLCLLVAAGAWLLWPSAHSPSALATNPAARATAPLSPAAQIAARKAALASAATNGFAAQTNRLAFRLTNTTKTIGQLAANHHAILLDNALILTDAKMDLKIPAHLRAAGDPGAYIVQARGTLDAAFRAALAAVGGQIVSYIPNNALLVQLSASGAAALAGNPRVQAVLPYDPYYKVQSSLLGLAVKQQPLAQGTYLTLGLFNSGAAATIAQIEKLGGKIVGSDRSPFGPMVRVQPPANWIALAQLSGVQRVEPARLRVTANDLSRSVLGVATTSVAQTNYLNLTGTNVLVEMNDTGVDTNLFGRVLLDAPGSGYDTDGHGTFVAGQIAGSGMESTTVTNAQGSIMPGTNLQFRGMAPAATLFSVGGVGGYYQGGLYEGGNDTNFFVIGQPFFLPGAANYLLGPAGQTYTFYPGAFPDWYFQEAPAATNALISNNSWVNGGDNEYDLSAASYDAAVRDAQPERTGPQPVLFVFAAGNNGQGGFADGAGVNDGGGGTPDSIASPGTAKNVITVGALEQQRFITNWVTALDGTSNQWWYNETDDSSQVAGFSSRGNVGIGTEGTYGRFKPDVVAPGTFVVSTRSTTWDEVTYYNPTNFHNQYLFDEIVATNSLNYYSLSDFGFTARSNVVSISIQIFNTRPNAPNMPIYVALNNFPNQTTHDFATINNAVNIPVPDGGQSYLTSIINNNGDFNFSIGNPTNVPVTYNLRVEMTTTNDYGDYYQVLSNLNNSLGTQPYYYRYESGTSMAAANVSGVLALMQDYFTNTLQTTPSPALLKALLINGARPTGYYNVQVNNTINYEGWGLVNLPNSIPPTLTNTVAGTNSAIFYADQSPANALATGDTRTYQVSIPAAAQTQPLRITLAWTDPPGNPAAAIKLVNSLSLTVTNTDSSTSPAVYYGNDIETNQVYNTAQNPTNSTAVLDNINNVQNVFLPPHAGTNFTIVVTGTAVNVSAVTTQTNAVTTQTNDAAGIYAPNITQDFVLVVASGDGTSTNGFTISPTVAVASNPTADQRITTVVTTNAPLMNQIVGASSPVMSTNTLAFPIGSPYVTNALLTIGQTNQWHFYVVTNSLSNSADYTNAAFITFLPQTLAIPREGVFAGSDANSTLPEANIDLYVSQDPTITNLNPVAIFNAINNNSAALSRGGTKFIVYSNSAPGQVYYVGVQSEDQMAAEYAFLPEFSNIPFSQMTTNGEVVQFFQVEIPDGNPALPGYTNTIGLAIYPMDLRRVIVTNILAQQNVGDLVVSLNHSTTANINSSVNLMLHNSPNYPGIFTFVYDDSGQGDITNAQPTAGPGSLKDYVRQQGQGVWILHASDSAEGFLGNIQGSLLLQPHTDLKNGSQATVNVQPHSWFYDYINVPVGYTNLTVSGIDETPFVIPGSYLTLALKLGSDPTLTDNDGSNLLNILILAPPGLSNSVSIGPPLTPGTYYVGIYNPDSVAHTVELGVTLAYSASAAETVDYASTGPVPILDDAVTYSYIDVPRNDQIQGINVGLRVDHPRISDLVFHLISPDGTRYLLMENRGADSTNGCGATVITTNIIPVSSSGGPSATTNFIPTGSYSGNLNIAYNMFIVPDQMTVYYSTNPTPANLITNFYISGPGQFTVSFPPTGVAANSTYLTIVMNETNHPAKTYWTYTAGGILTNYAYLSFTEDTNLTTTPIKFAPTPLVPQTVFSAIVTDSFEAYTPPNTYYQSDSFGGWTVATNQVDVATNLNAHTGVNYLQLDTGVVYTNVPTVMGQKYALTYWLASSVAEDIDGKLIPATTADWQVQTFTFTAASNITAVVLAASADTLTDLTFTNAQILIFDTNAIIDDVMLTQLPGNIYYQAEQNISGLTGNSAKGTMDNGHPWQLEILDTRAGATNNATLLSWQLEFTFANPNYLVVYPKLYGFQTQTNKVTANSIQWYQVNVPATANFATNILDSASGIVNLLYSANYPPTAGSSPGDMVLLTGSMSGIGSPVLSTTRTPLLVPGATYYLGVQNSGSTPVTSVVEVDFDHGNPQPGPGPASVQFNSVKASSAGLQLSWSVTSGAQYQVQWKTNLTAAWNTVTNPVTTTVGGVATFTDNGAQTAPLGPMRFYRLVRIP